MYKAFVCHYPLHGLSVTYRLLQSLTSPLSQTMLHFNMNRPDPCWLFRWAHHQCVAADIKLTRTILMMWIHSLLPWNITLAICHFRQCLVTHCQVLILRKPSILTICQMIHPGLLHPHLSCTLLPQHLKAIGISAREQGKWQLKCQTYLTSSHFMKCVRIRYTVSSACEFSCLSYVSVYKYNTAFRAQQITTSFGHMTTSTSNWRRHLYTKHLSLWVATCDKLKIKITSEKVEAVVAAYRDPQGQSSNTRRAAGDLGDILRFSLEAFVDALIALIVGTDQVSPKPDNNGARLIILHSPSTLLSHRSSVGFFSCFERSLLMLTYHTEPRFGLELWKYGPSTWNSSQKRCRYVIKLIFGDVSESKIILFRALLERSHLHVICGQVQILYHTWLLQPIGLIQRKSVLPTVIHITL